MKTTTSICSFLFTCIATLLIAACASQMEPAHQAIAAVDSALEASGYDAKRYIPEKYNAALMKLNALKVAFNNGDYKVVIAGAPAALAAAQGLTAAAAVGKEEFMKVAASEWSVLNASLPPLVSAVEVRGHALEKTRKLPEGVDLPTARRSLADARGMLAKAQEAANRGRFDTAVDTAKTAKRRLELAARALKLELPAS
jgi:malonyl CoA-acyl carrier protein transacylase